MSEAHATLGGKLNEFFVSLDHDEQEMLSDLVRSALLNAADDFSDRGASDAVLAVPGAAAAFDVPRFVDGLTGETAPDLIKSLRLPGSLSAYSIPGCNASSLVALRAQRR
jgi:hypothetical protein